MPEESRRLLREQSDSQCDDIKPHSLPPPYLDPATGDRDVQYEKLPIVVWMLEKTGVMNYKPLLRYTCPSPHVCSKCLCPCIIIYSYNHVQTQYRYYTSIDLISKYVMFVLCSHKALILVLTFICYTCYHLSRKPFSVVKVTGCFVYPFFF